MSKDAILHRVWTKAVGTHDYIKDEWNQLNRLVWGGIKASEDVVNFEMRAIAAEEQSTLWFDEAQRVRKLFSSDENLVLTPETLLAFLTGVRSRIDSIEEKKGSLEKEDACHYYGINHTSEETVRELQERIDQAVNLSGWAGEMSVSRLSNTIAAMSAIIRGVMTIYDLRKEGFDIDADELKSEREKLELELKVTKDRLQGLVGECNVAIDKNKQTCQVVIDKALEEQQKQISALSKENRELKTKLKKHERWENTEFPIVTRVRDLKITVTKEG